jgi:serine/threonine-protein kinase
MGAVFVARDRTMGDDVALKILQASVCDDALARRRFLREAQILERLDSDHVVGLRDYGFDEGRPFIVMDLLDGIDLGEIIEAEGALPISEAVAVARHTCAALAAVHAAETVHRDLKPENLVLVRDAAGRPILKLIDFGVAKTASETGQTLTRAESMLGTVTYMAPEQIRDPRRVDGRADIWAVGVMLYEMVTGEQPFAMKKSLVQLTRDIIVGEPPRPSELEPEVSPALEAIILRCLAKDPEDRFESVDELDAALAPLTLTGAELPCPRPSQVSVGRRTTLPAPAPIQAA